MFLQMMTYSRIWIFTFLRFNEDIVQWIQYSMKVLLICMCNRKKCLVECLRCVFGYVVFKILSKVEKYSIHSIWAKKF